MSQPADATLVALAMPLLVSAGAVNGTAFAPAPSGDQLYHLLDNVAVEGPPGWVSEGEVERCTLSLVLVRQD